MVGKSKQCVKFKIPDITVDHNSFFVDVYVNSIFQERHTRNKGCKTFRFDECLSGDLVSIKVIPVNKQSLHNIYYESKPALYRNPSDFIQLSSLHINGNKASTIKKNTSRYIPQSNHLVFDFQFNINGKKILSKDSCFIKNINCQIIKDNDILFWHEYDFLDSFLFHNTTLLDSFMFKLTVTDINDNEFSHECYIDYRRSKITRVDYRAQPNNSDDYITVNFNAHHEGLPERFTFNCYSDSKKQNLIQSITGDNFTCFDITFPRKVNVYSDIKCHKLDRVDSIYNFNKAFYF